MHLHGRAIGCFAHPYVKIFALTGFEEQNIITVVEFGKFIELVELRFGVEFRIFAAVREK